MKCRRWAEVQAFEELEARAGIEPAHKGFADLSLTTWVPRLGLNLGPESSHSALHLVDFCRGGAEWSGRRDLNSRPSPWQGDALPLSYSRLRRFEYTGLPKGGQTASFISDGSRVNESRMEH